MHKLEFLLERELGKKSRDERLFKRKLVRLAKYIDMHDLFADQPLTAVLAQHSSKTFEAPELELEMPSLLGKRKKREAKKDDNATETDSDLENLKLSIRADKNLDEFVTLGELGGKIPASLLVNVNFEKFAVDNDLSLIGYDVN